MLHLRMPKSVDDLLTSQSVEGRNFPDFEEKIAFLIHRVAGKPWAPEISISLFPCVPGIGISFFH